MRRLLLLKQMADDRLGALKDPRLCLTLQCSSIHGIGVFSLLPLKVGDELPSLPHRVVQNEQVDWWG